MKRKLCPYWFFFLFRFLSISFSLIHFHKLYLQLMEACPIHISLSETFKSLRKIHWIVARKHLVTSLSLPLFSSVCISCCHSFSLSFSFQPGGLQSFKVHFSSMLTSREMLEIERGKERKEEKRREEAEEAV